MIKPIDVTSPIYPLPADYRDLTEDGKWRARINACRQWMIRTSDVELKAYRFVECTRFFDRYYLHPNPAVHFDPMFYDMEPLPTPEIHWMLSRKWATSRQNADVMPRGAAKSTHMRKTGLLRMTTHPNYSQVYATSTHDNAKDAGQKVRAQVYENSRLRDDWDKEYGCPMKPSRGLAPSGIEHFFCGNGSSFRCVSAQTRLRGGRPRRFLLDDPEYDATASTSMAVIREYMNRLLFKIVLPMVMRPDCGVDWVGTFVSRRHFLWHAMDTVELDDGTRRAKDERFEFFNRDITRAVVGTDDDQSDDFQSVWPEMWPKDEAEKVRLNLSEDTVTLDSIRKRVGEAVWQSEYLANPGAGEGFFHLDSDDKGRHAWWIAEPDFDLTDGDPWRSSALMRWRRESEVIEMPVGEFLRNTKQFVTIDTSWTAHEHSDRKGYCHMAVNPSNELFVLGMWSAQCNESRLVNECLHYCDRWKVPVIYPEVVKESFGLYQRLLSVTRTRGTEDMGLSHTPAVKELRVGQTAKVSKIGALDLRIEHNSLKIPLYRRFASASIHRLIEQIQSFNPDADDGGLQHDDEIDMVAMSMFVLKGRLRKFLETPVVEEAPDALKLLRKGEHLHKGFNITAGLDITKIPRADIDEALAHAESKRRRNPHGSLA